MNKRQQLTNPASSTLSLTEVSLYHNAFFPSTSALRACLTPESRTVRKPHPQIPTWTADKFTRLGLSIGLNWLGGGGGGGGGRAGKIPWTDSITYSCSSRPKAVCWLQRLGTLQLSSFWKKKKKEGGHWKMFPPGQTDWWKVVWCTSRFLSLVQFFVLFLLDEPHSLGLTIDPCARLALFRSCRFCFERGRRCTWKNCLGKLRDCFINSLSTVSILYNLLERLC